MGNCGYQAPPLPEGDNWKTEVRDLGIVRLQAHVGDGAAAHTATASKLREPTRVQFRPRSRKPLNNIIQFETEDGRPFGGTDCDGLELKTRAGGWGQLAFLLRDVTIQEPVAYGIDISHKGREYVICGFRPAYPNQMPLKETKGARNLTWQEKLLYEYAKVDRGGGIGSGTGRMRCWIGNSGECVLKHHSLVAMQFVVYDCSGTMLLSYSTRSGIDRLKIVMSPDLDPCLGICVAHVLTIPIKTGGAVGH